MRVLSWNSILFSDLNSEVAVTLPRPLHTFSLASRSPSLWSARERVRGHIEGKWNSVFGSTFRWCGHQRIVNWVQHQAARRGLMVVEVPSLWSATDQRCISNVVRWAAISIKLFTPVALGKSSSKPMAYTHMNPRRWAGAIGNLFGSQSKRFLSQYALHSTTSGRRKVLEENFSVFL